MANKSYYYSDQEIADALGMSRSSVSNIFAQAMKRIRAEFDRRGLDIAYFDELLK